MKISQEQLSKFMVVVSTPTFRKSGQRIGQHFINTMLEGVNDPDLFYCEDEQKCWTMILAKYVEGM